VTARPGVLELVPRIRGVLRRPQRGFRSVGDFNDFLHGLRSRELKRLPPGARTVVHGGAAGSWYFEWFSEFYPTPVERHIGVEAYASRPPELGDEVEWLERSLGDLSPVDDGEADLVFAGQVIEHLWPDEITGFLLESHRVLRPAGTLAMDSPNRRVTTAIGWEHPEHTVEFRPDEMLELLQLAGFERVEVRGVWLCLDRERNRFLPLDASPRAWPTERRVAEAGARPDDSFVWWIEAERSDSEPDRERLGRRVRQIYEGYRAYRFARLKHSVGSVSGVGRDRFVTADAGEGGHLLFGPYVPMLPGNWIARFRLAAGPGRANGPFGLVDVVVGSDAAVVARRELTEEVLPLDGALYEVSVPFAIASTALSVEFRAQTYGAVPMSAVLHVDVEWAEQAAEASPEQNTEVARA
jgi:SAM-dependent methyltransferase